MANSHLLFLSYASPDRDQVAPYYDWLTSSGYSVWMDCHQLLPGQNWDLELNAAINRATVVVAFVSLNIVTRRGYVQRELKIALDRLKERLADDIFLIPILLDSTPLPPDLQNIQAISASDPECRTKILAALQLQFTRLGDESERAQSASRISWTRAYQREASEGLPGYRFELEFLEFSSSDYPDIADVSRHIRGVIGTAAFTQRAVKLEQSPGLLNYGQSPMWRTNEYDAHCGVPTIKDRVITVQYAIHWYGAGAAHPNYFFQTFSFLLQPLVLIPSLAYIFNDESAAFARVQTLVRTQLLAVLIGDPEDSPRKLDAEWVNRGTESWSDLDAFVFGNDGIELLFAPYRVAAYACGPQFATIPYEEVFDSLKLTFLAALGLEHLRYKNDRTPASGSDSTLDTATS